MAGTVTQKLNRIGSNIRTVVFTCTGDAADGSIPDTDVIASSMADLVGMYLYSATAWPTADGTAPDAADVQILMNGEDLLGAKGVNLIHATATQSTEPYSAFMTAYRYPLVTSTLTLKVENQETASADYTIELVFKR